MRNRARVGTTWLEPANGRSGARSTRALAAANWTRRAGADSARTRGWGRLDAAIAARSVTLASASVAAAARPVLPSARAVSSTSLTTAGPAAVAAAKVAGSRVGTASGPT